MTELIEVKTATLGGELLNWAMAQAEGVAVQLQRGGRYGEPDSLWFVAHGLGGARMNWAGNWGLTGPLLDSYSIEFEWVTDATVRAEAITADHGVGFGPSHQIAACRAIVAGKLGDTVLIPTELVAP